MARFSPTVALALSLALAGLGTAPLAAQKTHTVTLTGDRSSGRYRFDPDRLTVRPGDVVRFVVESGMPHTVTFDSAGVAQADQAALNAAMTGRLSWLSGPLLTAAGQHFDFVVPRISAGRYRYYCLPHRAYRSGGTLEIRE